MRISVKSAVLLGAVLLCVVPVLADGTPVAMTLKNHRFYPAEIHVKANQPNVIALTNSDDTGEEFDSSSLKVEKVIVGHGQGDVRLRPLAPGRYDFTGEFHADTAHGTVIAE